MTGTLRAQGESGAHSLIIPPGARANGLGQSYVAISDDATGIWWNPAGLAFVNRAVDLMHSQLVPELASDDFYEYFHVRNPEVSNHSQESAESEEEMETEEKEEEQINQDIKQ